jgi:hypothetical protein
MIKSHLQAALVQRVFQHVHVSSSTEITVEFSFVGMQECRDDARSDAPEPRILALVAIDRDTGPAISLKGPPDRTAGHAAGRVLNLLDVGRQSYAVCAAG